MVEEDMVTEARSRGEPIQPAGPSGRSGFTRRKHDNRTTESPRRMAGRVRVGLGEDQH